jgi:hypothetical protein
MKKEAAKVFVKYGNGKVEMIRGYQSVGKTSPKTTAVKASRRDLNHAIADCIIEGKRKERELIAEAMKESFREDWDSEKRMLIKY